MRARAAALLLAVVALALAAAPPAFAAPPPDAAPGPPAANKPPACRLFKTFQPAVGSSSIIVPDTINWEVASARLVGVPAGAAALSHGTAPDGALPLGAEAFVGTPAAGAWTLRAAQPSDPIPTWGLVLCPAPGVSAAQGAVDVNVGPDGVGVSVNPGAPGSPESPVGPPTTTRAAAGPSAAGIIGYKKDALAADKAAAQAAFLNSLDYFSKLSALNAEKVNDSLLAAIAHVDAKAAAARSAVGSLGKGLLGAAAGLRDGAGGLVGKVQALKEAGAASLAEKIDNFARLSSALAGAGGAATADVASVVGTAGELIKRRLQGAFGVYTTAEGMAKGHADTLVASKINFFNDLVSAAVASLDSIKAGKGPLVVKGVELTEAKLKAFAAATARVAGAVQAAPPPSSLVLQGLQFGQGALASSTSNLFSGISKFQAAMNNAFPNAGAIGPAVAQMAGPLGGGGLGMGGLAAQMLQG